MSSLFACFFFFPLLKHAVFIIVILDYYLMSKTMVLSSLLLLPRVAFAIMGLFLFHMNFRIFFSSFVRNVIDILNMIALNLCHRFGSMVILIIFILPIQKQEASLNYLFLELPTHGGYLVSAKTGSPPRSINFQTGSFLYSAF